MKMVNVVLSAIMAMVFLSGCIAKKEITTSQPYTVTIKTPSIAISDTGFLNEGNDYINVQIFAAGNALFNLEMTGETICLDGRCLDAISFNKHFFQQEHYAGLMHDILKREPIFKGQNVQQTPSGFSQEVTLENAFITYRVEEGTLFFKDAKNGILIRMKKI